MRFVLLLLAASCDRRECDVRSWPDADRDGYGDPRGEVVACSPVDTFVRPTVPDCDDGDPRVHPDAVETCDGVDEDCDGFADEGAWYEDEDGDGYGDPAAPQPWCAPWLVDNADDCDDLDPALHDGTRWYADGDGDGVGAGPPTGTGCTPPGPAHAIRDGDCDDGDPDRFPGALERCDDVDQDCDLAPDPPDAWVYPELAVRVPVLVPAGAEGPLAVDVDFEALLGAVTVAGPFDPASLRAVVHDCGGPDEGVPVPVAFLDHATGVLRAGGGPDPVGDEVGAVVLLPDRPVAEIGLYLQGAPPPPAPAPGVVEVEPQRLATAGLEATFDPARGGLLATLALDGGSSLLSQADATDGNGLVTPLGPLHAADAPATLEVLEAGPLTAAVRATGHCERDGGYDFAYVWRVFAGRPELWVEATFVATAPLTAADPVDAAAVLRPFAFAFDAGLADPACASDLAWADASDGANGVAWAWAGPPANLVASACDATGSWTAANDLPNGQAGHGPHGEVAAGAAWVDDAALVLRPYAGEAVDGAWLDARLAGASAVLGAPQAAP